MDLSKQVKHDLDAFGETPVILTLADQSILNETGDDVNADESALENAHLVEQEKLQKIREEGGRRDRSGGQRNPFDTTNEDGPQENEREEEDEVPKIASDYMTLEEVTAIFKKKTKERKLKKKSRRRKNMEEELIDELEKGTDENPATTTAGGEEHKPERTAVEEDPEKVAIRMKTRKREVEAMRLAEKQRRDEENGDDIEEDDAELREALARTRRAMNQEKGKMGLLNLEESLREDKAKEMEVEDGAVEDGKVVLDDTSEFVRTIRTRTDQVEQEDDGDVGPIADVRRRQDRERREDMEVDAGGSPADADGRGRGKDDTVQGQGGGDEGDVAEGTEDAKNEGDEQDDPTADRIVSKGMAGALEHFRLIGDLNSTVEQVGRTKDKRTDRESLEAAGPAHKQFKVKLEYIDDLGRELTQKEAFRRQCHIFHGKGPSRKRQEKQLMKDIEALKLKKRGAGGDTPLAAVAALKQETKKTGQAYVVLSGAAALSSAADLEQVPAQLVKGGSGMADSDPRQLSTLPIGGIAGGENGDTLKRDVTRKVVFGVKSSKRARKDT